MEGVPADQPVLGVFGEWLSDVEGAFRMTDKAQTSDKNRPVDANLAKWFWGTILTVSVGTFIFEMARMGYEWLRYGVSEKVVLQSLITMPKIKWVGVQSLISFIWTSQLFWIAVALTFISGWLWSNYDDESADLKLSIALENLELK